MNLAMLASTGLDKNFQFLLLETTRQVEDTLAILNSGTRERVPHLIARDDYIDTLKGVIEKKCFSYIFNKQGETDRRVLNLVRAVNISAVNLERIADFAVNIVRQLQYLRDPLNVQLYDYRPLFDELTSALHRVIEAMDKLDISEAMVVCRAESRIDELYATALREIIVQLRTGRGVEDLVTTLFIFRYLERMGDSLLNIGEAVISAAVGERLKIHQYQQLEHALHHSAIESTLPAMEVKSVWESRSGMRIGMVDGARDAVGHSTRAVFKVGNVTKVREELEQIERWEALFPGLPPRVLAHTEESNEATLLLEFLSGDTFQQICLGEDARRTAAATESLLTLVRTLWTQTLEHTPVRSGFVRQLRKRLQDVWQVHPHLRGLPGAIGPLEVPSFESLLDRAEMLDEVLVSPITVLCHGDFNTDNIIFNSDTGNIKFIDLHRSGQGDYAQDVSVFLMSNFRIPAFQDTVRSRLDDVNDAMLSFARGFAAEHEDRSFEARMALGLVRNFTTSTRFELDEAFSKGMMQRARYLLERLLEHGEAPWDHFRLPADVLHY